MYNEGENLCLKKFQKIIYLDTQGWARKPNKIIFLEVQKNYFIQKGVPVKTIRVEVGSAADKIKEHPVFYHLIDNELKENDLLLVTKIDRCSRNTLEFLKLQERLYKKGS